MLAVIRVPSPHYPHTEVPDGDLMHDGKPHAGYYHEITLLDQQPGRLDALGGQELQRSAAAAEWVVCFRRGPANESLAGNDRSA